ncbi:enoyl-CoA delta isomerase 1, mitochondrial-like [Diadema antillarum]|uniref:enoyl-CoA delta isomerase 1, mitochondrial-like n=2 Tax=Diadema antillarum TaxID=105358 RepID=UPI003A8429E1
MSRILRFLRPCVQHAKSCTATIPATQRVLPATQAFSRLFSDGAGLVKVDKEEGYAVMHLNSPPVNSLNTPMLQAITETIQDLEDDNRMQGLILTSACPKIFSAGLDITEMYQKSSESTDRFWRSLQDMWLTLYGTRLATVAAVNGHSPAGGCLMATSCDYRIMADGAYTIGLNEVHLGIVAPFWFKDIMLSTVGQRETERALGLGLLYKPQEALDIGLIDEISPEDEILDRAKEQLLKWTKIPGFARMTTKRLIRDANMQKLSEVREDDINMFTNFIQMDATQKHLGRYLASLKKK